MRGDRAERRDKIKEESKERRDDKQRKLSPGQSTTATVKRLKGSSSNEKTQSRSGGTTNLPPKETKGSTGQIDIHKVTLDAVKVEEELAVGNSSGEDLAQFVNTCDDIRDICAQIACARAENDMDKIEKLKKEGSLKFLNLKMLNRFDKFRSKDVKEQLQGQRQRVDNHHLKLQNLLYEVIHLEKESKSCQTFRSKDENIDLVPLDEFYKLTSNESALNQNKDPHSLHLTRLELELKQRKELEEKLKISEESKKQIEEEINQMKETLDKLHPLLKSIVDSTQPLYGHLNLPLQASEMVHASAEYLPRPLYVLYVQSMAYKHATKIKFNVKINGNVEDAKTLNLENSIQDDRDDEGDIEDEETVKKTKKSRHRKSISHLHDSKLSTLKKLTIQHPLSVTLYFEHQGATLSCQFSYILRLEIVTVKVHVEQTNRIQFNEIINEYLLLNLFKNDNGLSSPNPSNEYIITSHGIDNFSCLINEIGFGYDWAQRLAGLDFIKSDKSDNSLPSSSCSSSFSISWMDQTVKKMKERFIIRLALQQQINDLSNGNVNLPTELIDITYKQPKCIIKQINSISKSFVFDQLYKDVQLREAIESGFINISDCFLYQIKIQRGSASLDAIVIIPSDYPFNPSFFHLSSSSTGSPQAKRNTSLRELEELINCQCPAAINKSMIRYLLSFQLHKLQLGFDIYLEANESISVIEGPKEFSDVKPSKYSNLFAGRDHVVPFDK